MAPVHMYILTSSIQIVAEQGKKSLIHFKHLQFREWQMMGDQIEGLLIVYKNIASDLIIVEVKQQGNCTTVHIRVSLVF